MAENLGQNRTEAAAGHGSARVRALLVLCEMALALIVVTSAALMVRSCRQMTSIDLGFQPDHVLTMRIRLAESKYRQDSEIAPFFQELLRRVRPLPGIAHVAASSVRPTEGVPLRDFSIPGHSLNTADGTATADYRVITPDYFAVIRTPLREGRPFTEQDGPAQGGVAIVNERFARTYFPNADALGKQIRLESRYSSRVPVVEVPQRNVVQIVGVVEDSRQITQYSSVQDLYAPASPEIFVPFLQHPETGRDMALLLRTAGEPGILAQAVRQELTGIDADQPVYDVETLQALASVVFGPARLSLLLLVIFAGTALVTACVGLYAIISYTVAQRTHEIGIRMALGAGKSDVLRMVVGQGIRLALVGVAIGLIGALGLTRFLSSLLYGVKPTDPPTLVAVSMLLATVALLACYIPARRATRVDPMVALRYE